MLYSTQDGFQLYFDIHNPRLHPQADGSLVELPTIVVIHCGPGFDHTPYLNCFDQLHPYAQIMYVDMHGNGRSSRGNTTTWNYDKWTSDLKALFDSLGIHKPILLGHSWGGTVAQKFAIRYPYDVSRLILCATAARFDVERMAQRFYELGGEQSQAAFRELWINGNNSEQAESDYCDHCMPYLSVQPIDETALFYNRVKMNADLYQFFMKQLTQTFNCTPHLLDIQAPTLLIAGDSDPITPREDMLAIQQHMQPGMAQLITLADTSHQLIWEKQDELNQNIIDFVSS